MTSVLPSRTTRPVSNYIRRDDAPDVVAQIELLPHGGVVVEIDVGDVVEAAPAELLEEPRLSYLAGAIQDEGLAIRLVLSSNEFLHHHSVHASSFHRINSLILVVLAILRLFYSHLWSFSVTHSHAMLEQSQTPPSFQGKSGSMNTRQGKPRLRFVRYCSNLRHEQRLSHLRQSAWQTISRIQRNDSARKFR